MLASTVSQNNEAIYPYNYILSICCSNSPNFWLSGSATRSFFNASYARGLFFMETAKSKSVSKFRGLFGSK